jgi:homopolymeric O-antigen transport system permease protein
MHYFNPFNIAKHLWQYQELIRQLTRREVFARYKGSFFGLAWAFIQPLLMLGVYTFVFSVIFESKWGTHGQGDRLTFAMALFCGILTFNLLGDVANAAPGLVLGHANFVKKVIFPLEILPVVKFLDALIHACFGMGILLLGMLVTLHSVSWTLLLLPVVWLPMAFLSLGCGFFLSSLGVFVRDIGATVSVLVSMLFFLSPIFYPIEAVPPSLRSVCSLNPIAIYVEDARKVFLWGTLPDWRWYVAGMVFSMLIFVLGFGFFMRCRKAFADVI